MLIKKVKRKIQKFVNQIIHTHYASVSGGWCKIGQMKMQDDSSTYFDPFFFENQNKLFLFASKRNDNSIVRFEIDSFPLLLNETKVLKGEDNSWDEYVNRSSVIMHDGKYYMWYTGQTSNSSSIGIAISSDGNEWIKEKKPVLMPTLDIEGKAVMNPCVIYDEAEKNFKMWYAAGGLYEPDVIMYAESEDGLLWIKNENPVLTAGNDKYDRYKVGGCDVKKISNQNYIMFYIGYENLDTARVCEAYSSDGLKWVRSKNNPIISPTKGKWDTHSCYKPAYYCDQVHNIEYLVYNGRKNTKERIGLAYKKH